MMFGRVVWPIVGKILLWTLLPGSLAAILVAVMYGIGDVRLHLWKAGFGW
jgi:hypothetical protein